MPAGGPGDHPLTDILRFNFEVYNQECDELIRQISKLAPISSLFEMFDWFDNFSATENQLNEFHKKLEQKLDELNKEAQANGWETN